METKNNDYIEKMKATIADLQKSVNEIKASKEKSTIEKLQQEITSLKADKAKFEKQSDNDSKQILETKETKEVKESDQIKALQEQVKTLTNTFTKDFSASLKGNEKSEADKILEEVF